MLARTLTLSILALTAPGRADAAVTFTDVTSAAGVGYVQQRPNTPPNCLFGISCEPERMTGGVAVGDYDGDGLPDLYATRLGGPDLLLRNRGDGTFADATPGSGLDVALRSNGAAWGDIDRDGDLDLFVTTVAESRFYLYLNQGGGRFQEEAIARGADVSSLLSRNGTSAVFGDYDRDGWLDLHVGEWGRAAATPQGAPSHQRLLRNRGAQAPGHFVDVSIAAGVTSDRSAECLTGGGTCTSWGFASAFSDLDGDGWLDLSVASDFGTSQLFWNQRDGTFLEDAAGAGVGTDENGMGSTFGDYDGDGDLDWFVTSIWDPTGTCTVQNCSWGITGNRLYRNDGNRSFGDATDAAGVRAGFWGWGAAFFDADNDGDLDLVMTNGVDFPQTTADDAFNVDPMRYWENDGSGSMTERSAAVGLSDLRSGKGLGVLDYDADGDLDLVLANTIDGGLLYRNDGGNANDWLRIKLRDRRGNFRGLGARIVVQAIPGGPMQVREMGAASHFLGQSEAVAHFGLGAPSAAPVHQVTVTWLGGERYVLNDISRNRTHSIWRLAGCGLLGIEPLLVLAAAQVLRRNRRRRVR